MKTDTFSHRPRAAALVLGIFCFAVGTAAVSSQPRRRHRPFPNADHTPAPAGSPLRGLNKTELAAFEAGEESFTEVETPETGLGPMFNARGCAECHVQGGVGGSSADLGVSRVTRIGRLLNGVFDPLTEQGGMLLQARSLRELDPTFPYGGEVVPRDATLVSHRVTTPLFGAGLIEAIPPAEIVRRADPLGRNPDHIAGVPNMVRNPETGALEVGRFGWKAHVSDLHVFAGDAYLNEVGVTSATFPDESLPQGRPLPPGYDQIEGIEADEEDVDGVAAFMRFLAPPPAKPLDGAARQGQQLFVSVGCAACHTPSMRTGNSPVAALRNQNVPLFSDLLIHDMGDQLADGMVMGQASGRQWRTAPLWGLSKRKFLLHDGRATSIEQAILLHGGEGIPSVNRLRRLSVRDQNALLAFLGSL